MPPPNITPSGKEEPDLHCLTIRELELLSRDRMDKQTRDYYNEGADDGTTLNENQTAYNKYRIRPRVLRDISVIDTSVNIFGQKNSVPIGVAPTAMQRLAHTDGEVATARACKSMNVIMGLSSFSTSTLEEVAEANGPNARIRNQFKLPNHLKIANFLAQEESGSAEDHMHPSESTPSSDPKHWAETSKPYPQNKSPSKAGYHDGTQRVLPTGPVTFHTHAANPTLNWEESIPWIRNEVKDSDMQVWVKGIATAEDALLAVHHGVDGIVVSNHGGRQLNGALATLDALPEVVEAVKGKVPIHVDGGIRHGTDVFKALALGADFVWIGRPVLWGLAYKGEQGVRLALQLLSAEFRLCMALAGVTKVQNIGKEYLVRMNRDGFPSKL
ncbi:Hydroxyacid oxidase 1 [Cyphellophora attinorum]|uniref:Oxidase FUB9 n=1 Tax=Cyphellophora attinorum TaxID=1664694 RepID=A0A0N1HRU2_9EURO|nr:Hydroxyacid oxidase 1 [Phialophora attinorum]KPI38645.1 Hydroxyacid oxidase 1 [Phialophora attinorum]